MANHNFLDYLQELQDYLHTEVIIATDDAGETEVSLMIKNTAPSNDDGTEVVFTGVGLRINPIQQSSNLPSEAILRKSLNISVSQCPENQEVRSKYTVGIKISGKGFPEYTPQERERGYILFPQEWVHYSMKSDLEKLQFHDIRVEGELSRRHLFRQSKPVDALLEFSKPATIKTLETISSLDLLDNIKKRLEVIQDFHPGTTLQDIENTKFVTDSVREALQTTVLQLNTLFKATPNEDVRQIIRAISINYCKAVGMACDKFIRSIEERDIAQMQADLEGLRQSTGSWEPIKQRMNVIRSRFGLQSV